jgi:hypothetical protein
MAAPPPAGTATARKVSGSAVAPARRGAAAPARRAPLRVVRPAGGRSSSARSARRPSRLLITLSIVLVVGALLVVVVGQAMLASGQVRMSAVQHELSLEQASHRQKELAVAGLEAPARIISDATSSGMVHPTVTELPYVSLTTPLATPHVTPAPVAATTTSTTAPPAQ